MKPVIVSTLRNAAVLLPSILIAATGIAAADPIHALAGVIVTYVGPVALIAIIATVGMIVTGHNHGPQFATLAWTTIMLGVLTGAAPFLNSIGIATN